MTRENTDMVLRSTALAGSLIMLAATGLQAQRPSQKLAWLAGCWELQGRNAAVTHEMWLPPAGGLLLGASRTVRGDSVLSYEAMRIQEHGDTLVLTSNPSGQTQASFRTTIFGPPIVFENAQHDFPQRISYRPVGADSLIARIEGTRNGALRGIDYPYGRVPCTKHAADGESSASATLVAAERAFARDAGVRTVNEAFLAVLSDSAILFRPAPVIGRASLGERPMRANLSLVWTPIYAETSSDGQFGFDGGPSEFGERGQPPTATGFFFSVWRRTGSAWQLETDCGISSPIPARPDRAAHLLTTRTSSTQIKDARPLAAVEAWLIADYKRRYSQLVDEDARVYRNGTMPTASRSAALALISQDTDVEQVISRVVLGGSGELGYVIGVVDPNGPNPRGYQRLYRHGQDGTWKIAVDCRP
jgi:hypothetical protein